MASTAGWYIGRIQTGSVAASKAGGSTSVTDTVFQWSNSTTKPTVQTANITGLTAIVGGPYATQAAATAAATGDKNTTTATAGEGIPGVSTSTVNSSNGSLFNPLSSLDSFLAALTSQTLWIRVAKVVIGGALLIVGVAKLTGADKAVGGVVATAVKAAPLL